MIRNTLLLLAAGTALSACSAVDPGSALRGVDSVNQPVVTHQLFATDLAAPMGALTASDAQKLDDWFRSLHLDYGDSLYLDGPAAASVRGDVARIAGTYGLMLSDAAPVTNGDIQPGTVRVIVDRARASVPNCPNWRQQAQPNFGNHNMSGFGCAVNGNLAAMIANPDDLIHGREGSGLGDTRTVAKADKVYREQQGTAKQGLEKTSSKGS